MLRISMVKWGIGPSSKVRNISGWVVSIFHTSNLLDNFDNITGVLTKYIKAKVK